MHINEFNEFYSHMNIKIWSLYEANIFLCIYLNKCNWFLPSLNSFENEYAPNSSFLLMLPLNALLLNSVKKKSDMRGPTPTSSIPNTPRLPGITQMDLGGGNCPRFACSSFAPANPKCPPIVACSQCTIWTHAYMYLPPNHLMVLCVDFFYRTLLY